MKVGFYEIQYTINRNKIIKSQLVVWYYDNTSYIIIFNYHIIIINMGHKFKTNNDVPI